MDDIYIGLMTGTSLDAIDVAIADFNQQTIKLIASKNFSLPANLKNRIRDLCLPGKNEIDLMGEVSAELAELYSKAINSMLADEKIKSDRIKAIGSHGQTIRHRPNLKFPFTLQIGDPNIIAARTGITTIADFRSKDIALGGQGAPLAPAFHNALLKDRQESHWILNIGGIANLTYLPKDMNEPVIGFDTGPGNTLMDQWCQQHFAKAFDADGKLAASGKMIPELLQQLLNEPYFSEPIPKSTGRELFNYAWLQQQLKSFQPADNKDVQATLLALTAKSIASAINSHNHDAKQLWLCGGGVHNKALINELQQLLPSLNLQTTAKLGIDPDWIEATAFAWLAKQTLDRKSVV